MKTTDGDLDRKPNIQRAAAREHRHACQLKNNDNAALQQANWERILLLLLGMAWMSGTVGCLGTDNSRLVGRWEGQSGQASTSESSDSETQQPDSNAVFKATLDFRPDYRFSMKLEGSDGQVRQTRGTWRIDQATGTRWEVTLQQDDSPTNVRLRIAFDQDGFTARQVDGDDRIESIYYRQVSN